MATLRPEDLESPVISGTDSTTIKDIKVIISNTTTYISDADALKFQSANNIRLDAISVRTSAGSIVWVDPAYPEIVKLYQNGTYTGDINEVPSEGVIAIMYSTTEFKTYNTDVSIPVTDTLVNKPVIKTFGGGPIPILPPSPEDIPTTDTGGIGGSGGTDGIVPIIPPPKDEPTGGTGIVPIIPPPLPYTPLPVDPVYVPNTIYIAVTLRIIPSDVRFDPDPVIYPWTLDIRAIPLPLHAGIMAAVRQILNGKIESYFDQTREGKTLLNFGQDYQALLLNWQYDTTDIVNTEAVRYWSNFINRCLQKLAFVLRRGYPENYLRHILIKFLLCLFHHKAFEYIYVRRIVVCRYSWLMDWNLIMLHNKHYLVLALQVQQI
jgi:hypothetical protein